jgi:DNA-binding transcriptional LysR family regulator
VLVNSGVRRRLPPLEQIEAFIEGARAPSFRAAADACALSPAAFTRRVQALASYVGAPLFERTAGRLQLTEAGRRCLEELEPAYLELRRAAAAVGICGDGEDGRAVVALSLSHSLAVGWLIPRLEHFEATHPDISLMLRTRRDAIDIRRGDADLGLCFSDVDLAGLASRPLLEVDGTPVASPQLAAAFHADGGDLGRQRLLTVASPQNVNLWDWWAKAAGWSGALKPAVSFDILDAMYQVASEGFGVGMGSSPTVWPYLENGRLVRLGLPAARFPGGVYHLAARPERRRRRAVAAVWRWLEGQAADLPRLAEPQG